jgi:predicted RNase H-like HicB family nuclease
VEAGFRDRRHWRPLDQALAVLWQSAAWRDELIQLPRALPVPLPVHGHCSRAVIEAAYCYADACGFGVLTTDAPTEPFVCLGFATYESHEGERPMAWGASCASPRQTEITEPSPMELTAVLSPAEEGGYVAFNPETGTTTQGESIEEALANLREATTLYLEEFPTVIKGHPLVTMFTVPAHA